MGLLQARHANAHALTHSSLAADPTVARNYLRALDGWLCGRFPLASFVFLWRHRKSVFCSTSQREWLAVNALKYAFGYRLRQTLRPHRHPVLREIVQGELQFDPHR